MWVYVGVGLLVVGLGAAVKVQTARLDTCKSEHAAFVAQVKAAGDAQNAAAKLKDAENQTRMERANSENATAKSRLAIALNSLRQSNPGRSELPPAPAGSSRPDLACFDRAEYLRADGIATQKLFAGARGLADEGAAATVDLDTAKRWAVPAADRKQ